MNLCSLTLDDLPRHLKPPDKHSNDYLWDEWKGNLKHSPIPIANIGSTPLNVKCRSTLLIECFTNPTTKIPKMGHQTPSPYITWVAWGGYPFTTIQATGRLLSELQSCIATPTHPTHYYRFCGNDHDFIMTCVTFRFCYAIASTKQLSATFVGLLFSLTRNGFEFLSSLANPLTLTLAVDQIDIFQLAPPPPLFFGMCIFRFWSSFFHIMLLNPLYGFIWVPYMRNLLTHLQIHSILCPIHHSSN